MTVSGFTMRMDSDLAEPRVHEIPRLPPGRFDLPTIAGSDSLGYRRATG